MRYCIGTGIITFAKLLAESVKRDMMIYVVWYNSRMNSFQEVIQYMFSTFGGEHFQGEIFFSLSGGNLFFALKVSLTCLVYRLTCLYHQQVNS